MKTQRARRIVLFFLGVFVAPWAFPLLCLAGLQAVGVATADTPVPGATPLPVETPTSVQSPTPSPTVSPSTQAEPEAMPRVTEGSLVYRTKDSGRYAFAQLNKTDVEIDVKGLVASATVTQQFRNDAEAPIEAVYVFPLPHEAAVYDLELKIGSRLVKSVVKERSEAKRVYEVAKSEGKRAALVEEERPNIFTTSVANVMPGDVIDVVLRYVEPLRDDAGTLRLTFPLVVGPRYIPGTMELGATGTGWAVDTDAVPDASRITPWLRPADVRAAHDVSLQVHLDLGVSLQTVTSPSHAIDIRVQEDGSHDVRLANGRTLPNRDFVIEAIRADAKRAQSALFLSTDSDDQGTPFMLVTYPPTIVETARPPLEMLFVIDVSGSMEGPSIQQAREALLLGLDQLRPEDRFGIVAFNDKYAVFGEGSGPADAARLEAGRRFVRALRAGGGTEMLPALRPVMAWPRDKEHLRDIVLLTDGCLGNEDEIFVALERELGDARLFTVAIGSAPNHYLATKMADFGRGTFTQITDGAEVKQRMGELLERIASPVLADVQIATFGARVTDLHPKRLPDVFRGEALVLFGRLSDGDRGTLRLLGRTHAGPVEDALAFDTRGAVFHPGVTTLLARRRIGEAIDAWRSSSSDDEKLRLRQAIVDDAVRHNLVTRFTSRVAVEEIVANTTGILNQVPVATELPEGWDRDKVGGTLPSTGTADAFLSALAAALCVVGALLSRVSSRQASVRS